jgi:AcrR family transcriptional regulator
MDKKKPRKTDRRALYTRKIIKENFMLLLESGKRIEKITVSELCRLSEINRCTFYLHFPDIYGILKELQKEVQESMIEFVNASLADEKERRNLSAILFASIRENSIFHVLSRNDLISPVMRRVCDYSKRLLAELCVRTKQLTKREAELFALFLVNGCAAVSEDQIINHWDTFKKDDDFTNKILDRLYSMIDINTIGNALREKSGGVSSFKSSLPVTVQKHP